MKIPTFLRHEEEKEKRKEKEDRRMRRIYTRGRNALRSGDIRYDSYSNWASCDAIQKFWYRAPPKKKPAVPFSDQRNASNGQLNALNSKLEG